MKIIVKNNIWARYDYITLWIDEEEYHLKPESEILKELSKTPIYRTTMDGEKTEIEASEYLPESIKKLEFIGYFTKK